MSSISNQSSVILLGPLIDSSLPIIISSSRDFPPDFPAILEQFDLSVPLGRVSGLSRCQHGWEIGGQCRQIRSWCP